MNLKIFKKNEKKKMDALIKCYSDAEENKSNREPEWCVIRVGTRGVKSKVTPLSN